MLQEVPTKKFRKDVKRVDSQGKNLTKLATVIEFLKNKQTLEEKYKDHKLHGEYTGSRECHIEANWLLIYRIDDIENKLYLLRTGSHSELFNESFTNVNRLEKLNTELTKLIEEFQI